MTPAAWSRMDYKNTETKLETLAAYFNEERISLIPVFQRGKVWPIGMRKELIKNIVKLRPIPAIFLYKDEAGSKYSFNILDGKQRLESILMFIGSGREDFKISTWPAYIFGPLHKKDVGFAVDLGDGERPKKFADLDAAIIRNLREYPIPTIEIQLNENTSLDEMINLFIDINQGGVKVTRLNIVKALKERDPLLRDVFNLIAERQVRRQDVLERKKRTPFTGVLQRLQVVSSVADPNAQADRMWEKLLELALFVRSDGQHRKPSEILKTFIKAKGELLAKLTKEEKTKLSSTFTFLRDAYNNSRLKSTRLATDQTHFYIMATSLLDSDLLEINHGELQKALIKFADILDGKGAVTKSGSLRNIVKSYRALSTEKTTDVSRRKERQTKFIQALKLLVNGGKDGGKKGGPESDGVSEIRPDNKETSDGIARGIANEGAKLQTPKSEEKAG